MLLVDEVAGQGTIELGQARVSKPMISVRELLHIRVELEWRASDEQQLQHSGRPTDTPEARLNAAARPQAARMFAGDNGCDNRKIDRLYAVAEKAFLNQRIFVLLDDHQAEELDELVEVERTTTATFLLLTPLQGG